MANKKYWKFLNLKKEVSEILIYDQIGDDFWSEGIGAKQFAEELKSLGDVKEIILRINSPGGSIFEGLAIYNTLKSHTAKKTVYIDGLAASIASVIAMAGEKIYMPENSMMMVHDPAGFVMGNAEEMRKMADTLDKMKEAIKTAYKRTMLTDEEIDRMMTEETWMTAREAVEFGFADEVIEAVKMVANFDLSMFKNIPEAFKNKQEREYIPEFKKEVKNMKIEVVAEEAVKAEKQRVADILAMGEKFDCMSLAQNAVKDGTTIEEFKSKVLETVFNAKKVEPVNTEIGMSAKEVEQYSIVSAIRNLAELRPLPGLIKEASDAVSKIARREPKGFFIPQDVMKATFARKVQNFVNALSASDATKGGYLISTDVLITDMIELLRNKPLVSRLGARTLSGLVGNIAIPKVTGGAIAYWLPETGTVTASDQSFGQLGLTPKRLVGDTAYTKELIMQTSLDVEAFVRDDLMTVLALEKDRAAINGSGANGEPLGIMKNAGIGTVTFGGTATWAKVVDFETQLAAANADIGAMSYLTTPAVRGKWKTIVKFANTASPIWERGPEPGVGEVNGYPAYATNQVPDNKVIFGNWRDLIIAEWAGIDVVVDPYSLKKTGQIEVTITLWTDIGVRHPASFCVSTDSGAQ